jgi:DNA-binding NtrC family response regulator
MENYGFSCSFLVDGGADTRHALSDVLNSMGIHNIQEAEDGASAISIISHSQPDIVITEYRVYALLSSKPDRHVSEFHEHGKTPWSCRRANEAKT